MPARASALVVVVLLALLSGCARDTDWVASRRLDLLDTFPGSIAFGWGLSGSFQATPLLVAGLGITPVVDHRWGYADRTIHGDWYEWQAVMPWSFFVTSISSVPPRPAEFREEQPFWGDGIVLVYRWEMHRDAPGGEGQYAGGWEPNVRQWGRSPPMGRESGGALLIPQYRRTLNWTDLSEESGDIDPLEVIRAPNYATLWQASRDGRSIARAWDLFELDLFVGFIGLRFGFRPVEGVDFLAGFVGLDPLGDDLDLPLDPERYAPTPVDS